METKKQNIVVLAIAVVVSIFIWVFTSQSPSPEHFESRVFKVTNGWGYDVLVNDTIIIHQESIPVLASRGGFAQKKQAEKTAQLVIQKLKAGALPTLTKFDLDNILGHDETNNDRQRKME